MLPNPITVLQLSLFGVSHHYLKKAVFHFSLASHNHKSATFVSPYHTRRLEIFFQDWSFPDISTILSMARQFNSAIPMTNSMDRNQGNLTSDLLQDRERPGQGGGEGYHRPPSALHGPDQSGSSQVPGEILLLPRLVCIVFWVRVPPGCSYCFLSPRLTDTCPVET